ncbi:helix-turn-helix domain-containing protein [Psychroflexus sp. CAK1W]|nr:helix-turn-helix domain-containing protein [Psychroflexus curvus]
MTLGQIYQIQSLVQAGLNQSDIAEQLKVHRSPISRELRRNTPKRGRTAFQYIGEHAQSKTDFRHLKKTKQVRLTQDLKARIASLMEHEKWSPELIAKRLTKEGEYCVSHETIYKWIWVAKHSNHRNHKAYKHLHKHLSHNGRRQKRGNIKDNRGAITQRVDIEQHPEVVDQ